MSYEQNNERDTIIHHIYHQLNTRGVMKKPWGIIVGLLAVSGLFIVGCNKNVAGPDGATTAGGTTDLAIRAAAVSDPFVQNDEQTFADQDIQTMDYGTFGKIDAAITPLRWGRFVTAITKSVTTNVLPGDTMAVALVEKTITGTLRIKGKTEAGDTIIVTKPFTDKSTRNIILWRVGKDTDHFRWIPVASSLVAGGTFPKPAANAISITQVDMFLPNGDTVTVTDPNSFYLRYRWLDLFQGGRMGDDKLDDGEHRSHGEKDCPELMGGQMVKTRVTLVSTSPDTDLVALRVGFDFFQRNRRRMTLVSEVKNGNSFTRVFESRWPVHFHGGWFNVGVDAVTKGTLYDDTQPVSVSWWGMPYRVF